MIVIALDVVRSSSDVLYLDAVPDGEVASSWSITSFPVEGGTNISDHSQRMPMTASFRVIQTETPSNAHGRPTGPERISDMIEWLDACAGKLLSIFIEDRPTLRNMMITSAPWTIAPMLGAPFRLTFQEVVIVETQTAEIPGRQTTRTRAPLTPEANNGEGGTTDAADNRSAMVAAFDGVRSFLKR